MPVDKNSSFSPCIVIAVVLVFLVMAQLQIPIPDELLKAAKIRAVALDLTLREFVVKLLTRAVKLANSGGK